MDRRKQTQMILKHSFDYPSLRFGGKQQNINYRYGGNRQNSIKHLVKQH